MPLAAVLIDGTLNVADPTLVMLSESIAVTEFRSYADQTLILADVHAPDAVTTMLAVVPVGTAATYSEARWEKKLVAL